MDTERGAKQSAPHNWRSLIGWARHSGNESNKSSVRALRIGKQPAPNLGLLCAVNEAAEYYTPAMLERAAISSLAQA
jgi:hypothetical protein